MKPKMNPALAMSGGVSFVCAHCDKFWWGVERGLDGCKAHHERKECAGPVKGLGFPEYSGPLRGHLRMFCFVTGEPSTKVILLPNGAEIGATDKGIEIVNSYSEPSVRPRFVITDRPLDVKRG